MAKKSTEERTKNREQRIIEKFGPKSTGEKIVDINGIDYGFYTFNGEVCVIDYENGVDFDFSCLSNEDQKVAVEKLVVKNEFRLGAQPL